MWTVRFGPCLKTAAATKEARQVAPRFESGAATWVATDRRRPTMQANLDERTCESCGETFVTSEQDTSQYCSLTCRDNDSNPFGN